MKTETSTTDTVSVAKAFVDKFNATYESKHLAFEEQFWGTKMALSDPKFSAANLSKTKKEKENLLSDYSTIEKAQLLKDALPAESSPSLIDLKRCLDIIIRTCKCYSTSPEIKEIREKTNEIESQLEMARNRMELGYESPSEGGKFIRMSSVGLRNLMSTNPDEATRKAAYEGLQTIGPFVCENGFVEIVKLRNKLAKALGFEDFYDYKVTNSEGMRKKKLFEILDGLEQGTRSIMERSREELMNQYDAGAFEPWNTNYKLAGSVVEKMEYVICFDRIVLNLSRSSQKILVRFPSNRLSSY